MTLELANSVSWVSVPSVIFVSLAALALIAGAVAVIRASYAKAQIEGLRGDRDDLQARLDEARTEGVSCRTEVDKLRAELNAEVQKRVTLEHVVTGKQELMTVLEVLRAHDHRAEAIENMIKKVLERTDPR